MKFCKNCANMSFSEIYYNSTRDDCPIKGCKNKFNHSHEYCKACYDKFPIRKYDLEKHIIDKYREFYKISDLRRECYYEFKSFIKQIAFANMI
jgi:hypothetical protein